MSQGGPGRQFSRNSDLRCHQPITVLLCNCEKKLPPLWVPPGQKTIETEAAAGLNLLYHLLPLNFLGKEQ